MGVQAGFRVEGLSSVVKALKGLGLDVEDLRAAFARIAQEGTATAQGLAPKRTGRLAGSVRGNRAQSKAVVTAGRSSIRYAGPINYGWPARGIAASGFMQRTDQALRPRALTLLEDEVNHRIRARGL